MNKENKIRKTRRGQEANMPRGVPTFTRRWQEANMPRGVPTFTRKGKRKEEHSTVVQESWWWKWLWVYDMIWYEHARSHWTFINYLIVCSWLHQPLVTGWARIAIWVGTYETIVFCYALLYICLKYIYWSVDLVGV